MLAMIYRLYIDDDDDKFNVYETVNKLNKFIAIHNNFVQV